MIELTATHLNGPDKDTKVWVNVECIQAFYVDHSDKATLLILTKTAFPVRETPEEVVNLIRDAGY